LLARDTLTGLVKVRFDNQLLKSNKALLEFVDQVTQDDLLPIHLPDKVKRTVIAKLWCLQHPRGLLARPSLPGSPERVAL
jgi:hypothetical protein